MVRPPTPESNIAIGSEASSALPVAARSVRAPRLEKRLVGHEEDGHDDDQDGKHSHFAEPLAYSVELIAERVAGLQVAFGQLPCLARLRSKEGTLEGEERDDRQVPDAEECLAGVPVAVGLQVDPRHQQDDHSGSDQVTIDLLHTGDDRRCGAGKLRRHGEEEPVAKGRTKRQHDREDVQEERDLVAGVDDGRQHRAETYLRRRWIGDFVPLSATKSPASAEGPRLPNRPVAADPPRPDRSAQTQRQSRPARQAGDPTAPTWWGSGEGSSEQQRGGSAEPSPDPPLAPAARRPPAEPGRSCWPRRPGKAQGAPRG